MSGEPLPVAEEPVDAALVGHEHKAAWNDATLNANVWWSSPSITATEAATLMCGQNPFRRDVAPEKTSTDETTPADYEILLRVFADIDRVEATPRTLRQYHAIARGSRLRLRYHSWIDTYAMAHPEANFANSYSGDVAAPDGTSVTHEDSTAPYPAANAAAHQSDVFRAMPKLKASEVTIEFVAGASGGAILSVSARRETRRFALAELGLFDRRKGEMNIQCGLLLGMAQGEYPKTGLKGREKQVARLRATLKKSLGIIDNPILWNDSCYLPNFMVSDNRGAADERAKRIAERQTVSLEELQEHGVQFPEREQTGLCYEEEGDDTDKWIQANGG